MTEKELREAYAEQRFDEEAGLKPEPVPVCGNCQYFIRHFALLESAKFICGFSFAPLPVGHCVQCSATGSKGRAKNRNDNKTCPEFKLNRKNFG